MALSESVFAAESAVKRTWYGNCISTIVNQSDHQDKTIRRMTLVSVRPNRMAVPALFNEFDDVAKAFFGNNYRSVGRHFKPGVNVIEREEAFELQIALPGLNKEDFNLELNNNLLTLSVNKEWKAAEGEQVKRQEFGNYQLERSFRLGKMIDSSQVEASYENGVLVVALPKTEASKPRPARKIEIA